MGLHSAILCLTPCLSCRKIQDRQHLVDRVYYVVQHVGITVELPINWTLERLWNAVITRPDFKSEANFGFLSPNYTGKST